ncbi:MAG: flagellar biosynthesis protein FlhF [Clostridia bacterium]|jgi:flagellar biosynthesis protein FlhF
MKVKRFIGENSQDAMHKVKMSLGEDAVILHTRAIRHRGLMGFFKKPLVEIVAAVDEAESAPPSTARGGKSSSDFQFSGEDEGKGEKAFEELENKLDTMGRMLDRLVNEFRYVGLKDGPSLGGQVQPLFNRLMENEVCQEYAYQIAREVEEAMARGAEDSSVVARGILARHLGRPQPLRLERDRQKVVIFLGPTGAGKTTTLAKLAAKYSLEHGVEVGLITEDTYRIAAVEQLRTYGEIMGLPLQVIYSPEEVKDALKEFRDKQLIFIDTAGKSPMDRSRDQRMKDLIELSGADEIYLTISATTGYPGCVSIVEAYRHIQDIKLVFTKLDETTAYGALLNTRMLLDRPMAYFTTGQGVPDDIETANPAKIANHLIGRVRV